MTTPPLSSMEDIVKEFARRTGNDALSTKVCACCALEVEACKTWNITLDDIPNHTLLIPTTPHPKHKIFHGMLLKPCGIDGEVSRANLCHKCYKSLERNQLPSLSLTNNLWIGPVPDCLKSLTLAERLLIAKYLPTAYVVKLYPKQAGAAHWDPSQLYSGLKGSVSTYTLDPNLIASMVDSKVLPSPPTILSAAVAVTFNMFTDRSFTKHSNGWWPSTHCMPTSISLKNGYSYSRKVACRWKSNQLQDTHQTWNPLSVNMKGTHPQIILRSPKYLSMPCRRNPVACFVNISIYTKP